MSNFSSSDYPIIRRGGGQYSYKVLGTAPANLLAYWKLADTTGTTATDSSGNGRNGTYSNVTLGVSGIGDGLTAAGFAAASSSYGITPASFRSAQNMQSLTALVWFFRTAGTTTLSTFVDSNNTFYLQHNTTVTTATYVAGGTTKTVSVSTTDNVWTPVVIRISLAGDYVKIDIPGSNNADSGLGTWAGSVVSSIFGARHEAGQFFTGSIAHIAYWNVPISDIQVSNLLSL